jgi:hypothetical protein
MGLIRFIAKVALVWAAACALASPNEARAYLAADRWETTAAGPVGPRGEPVTLTWSLAPDGTPTAGFGPSNFITSFDAQFGAGDGADLAQRPWFPLLNSAFARWSELGGVTFVYEPHDDGADHRTAAGVWGVRGDVRLAAAPIDGSGGTLAASQYPDTGDILFDSNDVSRLSHPAENFIRLRNALMHEIGHALGLDHIASSDAAFLMEPALNVSFDGPQIDDIRGLHFLYGDMLERPLLDDSVPSSLSLGILEPGATVLLGSDAGDAGAISPFASDFLSISNRGDVDNFDFEMRQPARIDVVLAPHGGQFDQSAVGGNEVHIDASSSNNLQFRLFGPAGEELAVVDREGRGRVEMLNGFSLLAGGLHTIQIAGSREAVQLYSLQIRIRSLDAPEPTTTRLTIAGAVSAALAFRRRTRS